MYIQFIYRYTAPQFNPCWVQINLEYPRISLLHLANNRSVWGIYCTLLICFAQQNNKLPAARQLNIVFEFTYSVLEVPIFPERRRAPEFAPSARSVRSHEADYMKSSTSSWHLLYLFAQYVRSTALK